MKVLITGGGGFLGSQLCHKLLERGALTGPSGMPKHIRDSLLNDYSRKGFFDGRSARLPTVIVRPGQPNAAASSWASGMFREPLSGEPCLLPVRREQCHPMPGYRTVIESLI